MKRTLFPLLFFSSLLLWADSARLYDLSMDAMDWDVDSVVYWRWIGKSLHNLASGGYVSSLTEEISQPFQLNVVTETGKEFRRNYKKTYVLTLSLDRGRFVGSFADQMGTLLC